MTSDQPESVSAELRATVERQIAAIRSGEDADLLEILTTLWKALYDRLPLLTFTKNKSDQHRVLEDALVDLGFPRAPDLQYLAGPVLWYAREKGVLPPAHVEVGPPEPWTLDLDRYESARQTLSEGITAYGDWMRDALRALLAEQQ